MGFIVLALVVGIYKKQYHPRRIGNPTFELSTQTSTQHSPNLVYS
jgi:hypothetical protein